MFDQVPKPGGVARRGFSLLSSRGSKCPASEVEIGERQQREQLRGVLFEAAIAHLAVAKLACQNTEYVFDLRAYIAKRQSDGLSVTSVNRELQILRRMLRLAVEWGATKSMPKIRMLPVRRTGKEW